VFDTDYTSNSINLVDLVTQLRYISLIIFPPLDYNIDSERHTASERARERNFIRIKEVEGALLSLAPYDVMMSSSWEQ
jgi:hypothetical protein